MLAQSPVLLGLLAALTVIGGGCMPPPGARPLDIVPPGEGVTTIGLSVNVGLLEQRPTWAEEHTVEFQVAHRAGVSSRCEFGGAWRVLSFAVAGDVRCALQSFERGDPLLLAPFVEASFGIGSAATWGISHGPGGRAGVDLGLLGGSVSPITTIAVSGGTASYPARDAQEPPDGPAGPREPRREVRLETLLGVQFGHYRGDGWAMTVGLAPAWVLSSSPTTRPDALGVVLGFGPVR